MREGPSYTICEEARCPNIGECWGRTRPPFRSSATPVRAPAGTATSTRGRPGPRIRSSRSGWRRRRRPMGLGTSSSPRSTATTSPIGRGALRGHDPRAQGEASGATVEVLTPTSWVEEERWHGARAPTGRLRPQHRDRSPPARAHPGAKASYEGALSLLRRAKEVADTGDDEDRDIVGLGETNDEVSRRCATCASTASTSSRSGSTSSRAEARPIDRWVHPEEFRWLREQGEALGFGSVFSGPLVRSSTARTSSGTPPRPGAAQSPTSRARQRARLCPRSGQALLDSLRARRC